MAYDSAATGLFTALQDLEIHGTNSATLVDKTLTVPDLRLLPTLARFDVTFHDAFKCNIANLSDYPILWGYTRALYAVPGIAKTVIPDIYKTGSCSSSELRNPPGAFPRGPQTDWTKLTQRTIAMA